MERIRGMGNFGEVRSPTLDDRHIEGAGEVGGVGGLGEEEVGGLPKFGLFAGGDGEEAACVPVAGATGFDFDEGEGGGWGEGAGDEVEFADGAVPATVEDFPALGLEPVSDEGFSPDAFAEGRLLSCFVSCFWCLVGRCGGRLVDCWGGRDPGSGVGD